MGPKTVHLRDWSPLQNNDAEEEDLENIAREKATEGGKLLEVERVFAQNRLYLDPILGLPEFKLPSEDREQVFRKTIGGITAGPQKKLPKMLLDGTVDFVVAWTVNDIKLSKVPFVPKLELEDCTPICERVGRMRESHNEVVKMKWRRCCRRASVSRRSHYGVFRY